VVTRRVFGVALLLFGSGLTALVYQVAWLRELRLIFGSSTPATSAVIAIFLGGLGFGSLVLGQRVDAIEKPLLFYGRLELAIAGLAAVSPLLVWLVRLSYIAVGAWLANFVLLERIGTRATLWSAWRSAGT